MPVLPDVNVLLALTDGDHDHHAPAKAWLDGFREPGEIILCRISQLSLLRLLINPVVMRKNVMSGRQAWKIWDAMCADIRFQYIDEPASFESYLRTLTLGFVHEPRRFPDACLAAFAIAVGLELITFDRGFRTFHGLRHRVLEGR